MKPTSLALALHRAYSPFSEKVHAGFHRLHNRLNRITSVFQIPAVALRRELEMKGVYIRLPEPIKRAMYIELYRAFPGRTLS